MTDQQKDKILVVGSGPGGLQAALDLARAGYPVILAESSNHTGGLVSQLDVQFPSTACGFCRMLPMADRDKGSQHCLRRGLFHENIDLRLSCTLEGLEGEAGAFTAVFKQAQGLVDPEKCMGCGVCEQVCPVEVPDAFNGGLTPKKAIGRPCPQSFPNDVHIDPGACTRCGECETVCPVGAITLIPQDRAAFNILVVDDEAVVRDSMKEWLGLEGFGVDTADSGARALEMMDAQEYSVLLTDIKMPGMDGVALLARAKERQPSITVIMMTAYAEVDSAVNAMKQGALDYVTKPFEPDVVVDMIKKVYTAFKADTAVKEHVAAVILATGTGFYLPDQHKNIYGYGRIPNVVTALEFERYLSPAGPGLPENLGRIAWIQCVGSRDRDHGFCSSACCMISLKQALLARQTLPQLSRAALFYMDLRTPGKEFDQYRDQAQEAGVDLIRSRVHSIAQGPDQRIDKHGPVGPGSDSSGSDRPDRENSGITLHYVLHDAAKIFDEDFDMVVLAVGQAVSPDTARLIETLELETDAWGFVRPNAFAAHETSRPGIFTTGGLTGFKDIETTVTLAAAAAMSAAGVAGPAGAAPQVYAGGGALQDPDTGGQDAQALDFKHLETAAPRVRVMVCPCRGFLQDTVAQAGVRASLALDPQVAVQIMTDDLCTPEGWDTLTDKLGTLDANRLVVAGCRRCTGEDRLAELARAMNVPRHLVRSVDVLDLAGKYFTAGAADINDRSKVLIGRRLMDALDREALVLKRAQPQKPLPVKAFDRALVVGGGAAGMTAALAIARAGFGVDLVEKSAGLGGNLKWVKQTIDGQDTCGLLQEMVDGVTHHPDITVHLSATVAGTSGMPGQWTTTIESSVEDGAARTCGTGHGVVVLATGGNEATGLDTGTGIYTQKKFQAGLDSGQIDPSALSSVVMIQCRNCREKDKNYCSRVCCPRALFQALFLKQANESLRIYVLYRDMMTPGTLEACYTKAREAGVIFIPYTEGQPPGIVDAPDEGLVVACHDPVLGRDVEIEADAVVTAVGIEPELPEDLARMFGAHRDGFGFFEAADSKFRPVDARHPRVLGCGMALAPCDIPLARATALAAAVRAAGVLSGTVQGPAAQVKPAYCSLCLVCIDACPFDARTLDRENQRIVVDAQACQGCGICESICPAKAARVDGKGHFLNMIDRVLAS